MSAVQPPPSELLDEERLCRLLTQLEFPQTVLRSDWLDDLYVSLDGVFEHAEGVRRWWTVDEALVKPVLFGRRRSAYAYGCDCPRRGLCSHVAAVLLCLAWGDPDWRPRFMRPLWELDLMPLVVRPDGKSLNEPHKGHVRYHLVPGGGEGAPMRLRLEVIRRARRGGGSLKAAKAPKTAVKLRQTISPIHPWDLELHAAALHLDRLASLADKSWKEPGQFDRIAAHLGRSTLRALAAANDVRHMGEPVTVVLDPVEPRITAHRDGGRLRLTWHPQVLDAWEGGVVLTGERELRPLPEGVDVAQLLRPLPSIPHSEESEFVEQMVVARGLPVDLPGDVAGVALPQDKAVRVVLEEEQNGVLLIRPTARYVVNGEPVQVDLGVGSHVFADPDVGLVRRDLDWEAAELRLLRSELPPVLRLSDDAALDFLTDSVPTLQRQWAVFGDQDLLNRSRGAVEANLVLASGVDWFDLDVHFAADDQQLAPARVLRSWLDGQRYHRLDDGTVARLPEQWLMRHGDAAQQLVEMKAQGGTLGGHAAWVLRDLLAEVGKEAGPWQELADRLADFKGVADHPVPSEVKAELRPYQREGVSWLAFLREHRLGGVLADDMGLGKTLQVLAALADVHLSDGAAAQGPSLVVAPTSVLHNWAREAARFTPRLRVVVHHGPRRQAKFDDVDLVITSYALLRLDAELLGQQTWCYAVLDEAQAIKNPASHVARVARGLNAAFRLAMTGTPLENRLGELWSLFSFVMPGFFGPRKAFARRFEIPIERQRNSDAMDELRLRIRPFLLRRLKSEVAADLPPRQVTVLRCELSQPERELYERVRETYRTSVLEGGPGRDAGGQSLHVLEALTRLRQACCHPSLLPFDEAGPVVASAKLDLLMDKLDSLSGRGHRSLVFSQWPSLLKIVRRHIAQRGWRCLYLDGATRNRDALVTSFSQPEAPPIFLISVRAGGTGLNLTAADCVFHLDPWWNPAVEDQATDRAHRIGQDKPVLVYRLIAADTVEEKVLELQQRKRSLAQAALDGERLVITSLTREDLEAVFNPR